MIDTVHIAVCMKPIEGNFASNALSHGVSGLNVDGCRVAGVVPVCTGQGFRTGKYGGRIGHGETTLDGKQWENTQGRWPANVITDGSEEVKEQFPEGGGGHLTHNRKSKGGASWIHGSVDGADFGQKIKDSGSAARFFQECPGDEE